MTVSVIFTIGPAIKTIAQCVCVCVFVVCRAVFLSLCRAVHKSEVGTTGVTVSQVGVMGVRVGSPE